MESMKRTRNPGRWNRRGTAVVEGAIVFPLLLLLTLGAIEYGWLFYNIQQITNAARQGARTAAVLNGTAAEGKSAIDTALSGTAVRAASSFYYDVNFVGPSAGPSGPIPALVVATVRINTSDIDFVNAPSLFPVPTRLRAVVKMAREGI
jgi:Flp pilus assembly protein TadG